jgi:hypothetical protein
LGWSFELGDGWEVLGLAFIFQHHPFFLVTPIVFLADKSQPLYNSARAHDLSAVFNDKLRFGVIQLDHLEKPQRRVLGKRTRLESQPPGDFDTPEAIRACHRMP